MYRNAIVALILSVVVGVGSVFAGGTNLFNATIDNDFSNAGNWSQGLPVAAQDLQIQADCAIDSGMNDLLDYGNVTFSSTGILRWSDTSKKFSVLSVTGTLNAVLDMTNGGTLILHGAGNALNIGTGTFTTGVGTIEFALPSPSASQTISAENYYELRITGPRAANDVLLASGNITVAGDYTNIATFDPTYGVKAQSGSTVDFNGTGGQKIGAAAFENLTISGARGNNNVILDAGTISVSAMFSVTATFTPPHGVIADINNIFDYNGTLTQAIAPVVYGVLKISGARASDENVYFSAGKAVVTSNGNALDISNLSFSGAGTLSCDSGSIVEYAGASAQNVTSIPYDGLALSGPGQKNIFGGPFFVFNTLNVNGPFVSIQSMSILQVGALNGSPGSVIDIDMTSVIAVNGSNASNYAGAFSGAGLIAFNGMNGIFLSGNSPGFTGDVAIDSGFSVVLQSATALGTAQTTVSNGGSLISDTSAPIMLPITLSGGRLGAANLDDRKFAGSLMVTTNSNISLVNEANTAQPVSLEISGTISIGAGKPLAVSGPPPVGNAMPKVLRISGALSGGTVVVGPSAEVEIAATGTFTTSTVNVGTGGILTAKNTSPNQSVNVNLGMGAVLRGTGEFSDFCALVSAGGIIQPGPIAGAGTLPLTTGAGSPSSLTLDSTTILEFDLGSPTTTDKITVSGALVLDGSLVLKPAAVVTPGTYTLLTHGGLLTDNTLNLPPAPPGLTFALDATTASSEVRLVITAQPITLNSQPTFSGTVGESFTYLIVVNGPAVPPITVTTTALPPGLHLEGTNIVGNPTQTGVFNVTLTATNGITTTTQPITITIIDPVQSGPRGPFAVEGRVGTYLYVDVADYVSADISNNVFTVDALPEGLKLAGSTISGIPKTAGSTVSTIVGTDPTDGTSGSLILNFTILEKTATLGPVLTDLLVDPDQPGVNEVTLFFVDASHPDNLPVTVTWDFGDGTTATGEFVEKTYTAANTYTVTVTGTAGGKSTQLTQAVVVSSIDPNAPVISDVVVTPSPSVAGQLVTFTATTSDLNSDAVTVKWTFGDGVSELTGNPVTFTYQTAGKYLVTAIATDATGLKSRTFQYFQFVGKGSGVDNLEEGDSETSFDGITQVLTFSEDGLLGLTVSEQGQSGAFNRADMEADTDFGITGRRAVKGGTPSAKVEKSSLIVAKTVVREKTTRKERGKARKTIGVSKRETKEAAEVDAEPDDKNMNTVKLKGNFFPSRSATTGTQSRAVSKDALPSDTVTASGAIMMPEGLDLTNGTTVEVALGNIVDKVVIDAKGKGKGKFTNLMIKIKTDKTTKKSVGNVAAKFSIKMSVAEMTTNGFDTEGVVVSKEQSGAALSIQCAMLIGGVVYTTDNPVSLKVSPKEDKASMTTRKAN